jgi:hypothetical protein
LAASFLPRLAAAMGEPRYRSHIRYYRVPLRIHRVAEDRYRVTDSNGAAQAHMRWSAEQLSVKSAASLRTIRRAELAEAGTAITAVNDLRRALEAAGVEFIEANGGGPGVRLRAP